MADQDSVGGQQVHEWMDGDIRAWIEQGAIHIVAYDRPYRDPVELTSEMARELAATLEQMADRIDRE